MDHGNDVWSISRDEEIIEIEMKLRALANHLLDLYEEGQLKPIAKDKSAE